MKPRRKDIIAGMLLALLIVHAVRSGGGGIVAQKVTAAVYVYEQRQGSVPAAVLAAFDTLNRQGIMATSFDVGTVDGTNETPDQYKVPLTAATEAGLPALVVMGGNIVVRLVKAPTTDAQVLEAAK